MNRYLSAVTLLGGAGLLGIGGEGPAPVNLAPNSQWEVWSGVGFAAQATPDGRSDSAALSASGNSTDAPGRSTLAMASTGALSVGDLVTVSGGRTDACLTIGPMRIVAMVPNRSITLRTYRGCTPGGSAPSSVTMVGVGNRAAIGTGDGPDNWTKSVTMPVWRNEPRGPYAANMPDDVGAMAALGARKDAAAERLIYTPFEGASLAQFAGKKVVFGIHGLHRVRGGSGTWRIYVNDGVSGPRRPCAAAGTSDRYQWLECSFTVPMNPRFLHVGVALDGAAGDTYYFANPVLALGGSVGGAGNYQKPRSEILVPKVHISPTGWIDAKVTFPRARVPACGGFSYCFERDFYAETGGRVATTVLKAQGQLEGYNCNDVQVGTGVVRLMAWYDRSDPPSKSGSFLSQAVRCVKSFSTMDFPLNQSVSDPAMTGTGLYMTMLPGDSWDNVSEELDWFVLG